MRAPSRLLHRVLSAVAASAAVLAVASCSRTLEVGKEGAGLGKVTATGGAALDCGETCTASMSGAPIELAAAPDDESDFGGWGCVFYEAADATEPLATVASLEETLTIGDAPVASLTGPVPFDRVAKAVCDATFTVEPLISVVIDGPGTVTSGTADVAIDCGGDCDESVSRGTAVELSATGEGDARFVGWSEGCSGTDETTTVSVSGPTICRATFVDPATRATLTLVVQGEGSFTSTPAGITDCSAASGMCAVELAKGTDVELTATLPAGHTIAGWSGGCTDGEITLDDDATCTVIVQPPPATVTWSAFLTKQGAGAGSVTSSPAGIDCGDACTAADDVFAGVNAVSLTAVPAGAATFGGFSCACAYSGVAPGTVACVTSGGTGAADTTVAVTLNGLENARGHDVVVRLDCAATFNP